MCFAWLACQDAIQPMFITGAGADCCADKSPPHRRRFGVQQARITGYCKLNQVVWPVLEHVFVGQGNAIALVKLAKQAAINAVKKITREAQAAVVVNVVVKYQ